MSRPALRAAAVLGAGILCATAAGLLPDGGQFVAGGAAAGPLAGSAEQGVAEQGVVGQAGAGMAVGGLQAGPGDAASRGVAGAHLSTAVPSVPDAAVPAAGTPRWLWPVTPRPAVLRVFRAPASPYGAGHRGLDLAVTRGTLVLAVDDGHVTHAGTVAGRGTVTVEHRDGLRSTYEPVDPAVRVGDGLEAGDLVGRVMVPAGAHCGALPCLHLGARQGDAYLDPLPLLAGGRLALLPLG